MPRESDPWRGRTGYVGTVVDKFFAERGLYDLLTPYWPRCVRPHPAQGSLFLSTCESLHFIGIAFPVLVQEIHAGLRTDDIGEGALFAHLRQRLSLVEIGHV
jgi:hypothetical protein